jgi:hypothetical protein
MEGIKMRKLSLLFLLVFSATIGFMYVSETYAVSTDGLVAYYSFNDGTAKDESGKGNHGKFLGAPKSVAGKKGNCLDFNGKTDGIDIADSESMQLADALTVAAWINIRKLTDQGGICWKGEKIGWGANYNYRISTTADGGIVWGTTTKKIEFYFSTGAPYVNKWSFICLTADGVKGIAYVTYDGVNLTIAPCWDGNYHPALKPYNVWKGQPVRIGYSQGRNGDLKNVDYFDGMIDEVVIYNRALSEAELKELMNQDLSITATVTAVDASGKTATKWAQIKAE